MASRRRCALVLAAAATLIGVAAGAPVLQAAAVQTPSVRIESASVSTLSRTAAVRTISLPIRSDMLGASWQGSPEGFELRSRAGTGRWSSWVHITGDGDGPDPTSAEAQRMRGRQLLATPIYVGRADQVQIRAEHHALRAIRIDAINTTGTGSRADRASTSLRSRAASLLGRAVPDAAAIAVAPKIRLRTEWKAVQPAATPYLAPAASGVVVHHTVSVNSYSCSAVPALLRGIQRYHMRSNGWNDIGYNFIVDRCGGVWEARGGGVSSAVVGAHTAGFNTGTVGIALLGTHSAVRPSAAARAALQRLIAWRMDVAHVLPSGTMKLTAGSGDKFPVGKQITARAVSGHRDLFPTSCPGAAQYRLLKDDATRAARIGGLKVANITSAPKIDVRTGELRSVTVRAIANAKTAMIRIALERISTGEVLAQQSNTGGVAKLVAPTLRGVPVWDVRVRANAATASQRARGYLEPLRYYSTDPGFVVVSPPPASLQLEPTATVNGVLQTSYTLTNPSALVGAWLYQAGTDVRVAKLATAASLTPTTPTMPNQRFLDITIPARTAPGAYELRIGVEGDTAPGRSIRRYALTIAR